MVYRSDCRYLPYSIHFSEFMSICFTRKRTKHERYENVHRRLLGAQSINAERASLMVFILFHAPLAFLGSVIKGLSMYTFQSLELVFVGQLPLFLGTPRSIARLLETICSKSSGGSTLSSIFSKSWCFKQNHTWLELSGLSTNRTLWNVSLRLAPPLLGVLAIFYSVVALQRWVELNSY